MLLKYLFRLPLSLIFALLCVTYARQLAQIAAQFQASQATWFLGGFAAYIPIHVVFKRLIVVHVFSHELTHALWSALFGGKVDEIYISRSNGGYTRYTRGNFLVTLAPYFFPLYALVFFGLYFIVRDDLKPVFSALCGFSVCFHIILTLYSMRIGQPDLRREGYFFALPLVFLMNLIIIGAIYTGLNAPCAARDYLLGGGESALSLLAGVYEKAAPVVGEWGRKLVGR